MLDINIPLPHRKNCYVTAIFVFVRHKEKKKLYLKKTPGIDKYIYIYAYLTDSLNNNDLELVRDLVHEGRYLLHQPVHRAFRSRFQQCRNRQGGNGPVTTYEKYIKKYQKLTRKNQILQTNERTEAP